MSPRLNYPTEADTLEGFLAELAASCWTGRLQVTLDFNRGGVSRLRVEEVVPIKV